MLTRTISALALGVVVVLLLPSGTNAEVLNLCSAVSNSSQGGWILDISFRAPVAGLASGVLRFDLRGSRLPSHDTLRNRGFGFLMISDGTSTTILVMENPDRSLQPSCVDLDGDDIAGIAMIRFELTNVLTGEPMTAAVIPLDGELDDDGEEPVLVILGDTTLEATAKLILRVREDLSKRS